MEWHFNYTPYAYCFNNPVSFIDPMGMDTTKSTTVQPPPEPELPVKVIPEVIIRPPKGWRWHRFWGGVKRFFASASEGFPGQPEPYRETEVEDGVDMDWYKSEESYGNQDVVSRDNPNYNKIFKDRNQQSNSNSNSNNTSNTNQTSDEEINKKTGNNTDKSGKPIEYQGQETDSNIVEVGVMFYDDSVMVRKFKQHKNSHFGRYVSKPYAKKYKK